MLVDEYQDTSPAQQRLLKVSILYIFCEHQVVVVWRRGGSLGDVGEGYVKTLTHSCAVSVLCIARCVGSGSFPVENAGCLRETQATFLPSIEACLARFVVLCSTFARRCCSYSCFVYGYKHTRRRCQALVLGAPSTADTADGVPNTPNVLHESAAGQLPWGVATGAPGARANLDAHPGLGVTLFCAGDEDQHIYGWRGTTVDHLHRFVLGTMATVLHAYEE